MGITNGLGPLVSDLVAGAFALVSEAEHGALLRVRIAELRATCNAILKRIDLIESELEQLGGNCRKDWNREQV